MFIGDEGWIGLRPSGAETGDRPFFPKGLKIPIIVKRLEEGLNREYNLAGEGYCHGLKAGMEELSSRIEENIEVI